MTNIKKLLIGATTVSMAFLPAFARAESDINVDTRGNANTEIRAAVAEWREARKERGEKGKNGLGLGLRAKVDAKVGAVATTTVEAKLAVRAVAKAWNEYRATVQDAKQA